MYTFISVMILITCILIILIVLIQNSKGGGLASNFSSSNQIMGVQKTADFLEKATWTLAIILLALSLFSVFVIPKHNKDVSNSELKDQMEKNMSSQSAKNYQAPPNQENQIPKK